MEGGVEDFSQRNFLVSSFADFAEQERLYDVPLLVGEVGRIRFSRHFRQVEPLGENSRK
jgi:hypothetical protein